MKKSRMCFPLSLISALFIIATGILFISLEWGRKPEASSLIVCITSGIGLVFAIGSLIRAKIEKENSSTLRSTGILSSWICLLCGISTIIFSLVNMGL